jgi:uncharacterized protein YjiS (DUF1127 family)
LRVHINVHETNLMEPAMSRIIESTALPSAHGLGGLLRRLRLHHRRSARLDLESLPDYLVRDLGLSRGRATVPRDRLWD